MKNSKYVKSWWVEKLPNGIYHALFNLTERGLDFHAYNDEMFTFESREEDWDCIQEIPKFLPESKDVTYLRASGMEKDQCSFYWIPHEHKWIKEKQQILFKSDDK